MSEYETHLLSSLVRGRYLVPCFLGMFGLGGGGEGG